MKTTLIKKMLVIVSVGVFSQSVLADNESAAKSIASILVNLNHFPSADDKVTLKTISEDEGTAEALRAVAMAVHNIQHSATAEDKAALAEVIANDMATAEVKALAEIVVGINHVPSADAKTALQAML